MSLLRALRYARAYRADGPRREEEVPMVGRGEPGEATLLLPPGGEPDQAWIVLHGLTVGGRRHPALLRFAGALVAAGGAVLIPDIPAWRELRIDVGAARETILGALPLLEHRTGFRRVGVVGFSFGATHALIAAADPELRERVGKVIGFGGYAELQRTIRCMFTGEHEWRGTAHRLDPDPYGRWIAAANYLPHVSEYAAFGRVADAAHRLALEAGHRAVFAGSPSLDAFNAELAAELEPEERALWELIAPATAREADDRDARRDLAARLVDAALRVEPSLDPAAALPELAARAILVHGRTDRLVPFTETLRLAEMLPPGALGASGITGLLSHSGNEGRGGVWERARESARFLRLLVAALR